MQKSKLKKVAISIIVTILGIIALALLLIVFVFLTQKDRSVIFSRAKTFSFNNTSRTFRIAKPKNEIKKIVIGLHGFGDNSRQFAYYTALHNSADDNTLVVYPDAVKPNSKDLKPGWNSGFCCGSGWVTKTDDTGFILALIEDLKSQNNAKSAKVYVTGFSNGAFMSQKLIAEHPEVFSAAVSVSGSIGTTKDRIKPTKPAPILLMHGQKDTTIPFDGGQSGSDPDFDWLSFEKTKSTWEKINTNKAETKTIIYSDDSHRWHGWRIFNIWDKQTEASSQALDFFSRH